MKKCFQIFFVYDLVWNNLFRFPIRRRHLYGPANASNRSLGVLALHEDTLRYHLDIDLYFSVRTGRKGHETSFEAIVNLF